MHFGEHWVSLPVKFNWQPHQIRFLFDGRFEPGVICERSALSYEEICIVHFSAKEKPRNFLFERGRRPKEEFKESLVAAYLGRDIIATVTTEQRGNIEKAIDEWFKAWEAAWDMVLQNVASCEQRCPACGSQELGYNDPLHCFFTCNAVAALGKTFMAKTQRALRSQDVSPMLMLKNASAFPWALKHVDDVHKKRLQETAFTREVQEARSPWHASAHPPRQRTPPVSHSTSPHDEMHDQLNATLQVLTQILATPKPAVKTARPPGPIGAGYRSVPINAGRRVHQIRLGLTKCPPRVPMPPTTQQTRERSRSRNQDDSNRWQRQSSTGSARGSQWQKQSSPRSAWDSAEYGNEADDALADFMAEASVDEEYGDL